MRQALCIGDLYQIHLLMHLPHAQRMVTMRNSPTFLNQGERIRTSDLVAPNHALYQAELRPGVVQRAATQDEISVCRMRARIGTPKRPALRGGGLRAGPGCER